MAALTLCIGCRYGSHADHDGDCPCRGDCDQGRVAGALSVMGPPEIEAALATTLAARLLGEC